MIDTLEIDGFKSLMDLRLPFRRITVLVGGNATGKSSVIQSLLLLRQSVRADGAVDRLNLMGPLFEGGTAADVINPRAKTEGEDGRILRLSITWKKEESQTAAFRQDFRFLFERNAPKFDSRVLPSAADAYPLLPFPLRPSGEGVEFSYLSAERVGPRSSYSVPTGNSVAGLVGKNGEFTAAFLSRALRENLRCSPALCMALSNAFLKYGSHATTTQNRQGEEGNETLGNDERVVTQVNRALRWVIPGASFDAEEHAETDSARLGFYRMDRSYSRIDRPTNIGFGLTYVLPVLASAVASKANGLFVAENVECHLHPGSQSRIGVFLASVSNVSAQVLLETHSDHVINGIRLAVKLGLIDASKVIFHYFRKGIDDETTQVSSVEIDESGNLSQWPEGFLDQIANDLARL